MADTLKNDVPPLQLRDELETLVLGDLFGSAGGSQEQQTERTVRNRRPVGMLAPSRSGATDAEGGILNARPLSQKEEGA